MTKILKWMRLFNYFVSVILIGLLLLDSEHKLVDLSSLLTYTMVSMGVFLILELYFMVIPKEYTEEEEESDILDT